MTTSLTIRYFNLNILLIFSILLLTSCFSGGDVAVKDNTFTFNLPDLSGKTVSLSDVRFQGKVVIVDIWGTWCPPCREQIPSLIHLQEKYRQEGLEVIGIAFEREAPPVAKRVVEDLAKKMGINYSLLLGGRTGEVSQRLPSIQGHIGFPTTIYIGRDGKVAKVEQGFGPGRPEEMEEMVVQLLRGTQRGSASEAK